MYVLKRHYNHPFLRKRTQIYIKFLCKPNDFGFFNVIFYPFSVKSIVKWDFIIKFARKNKQISNQRLFVGTVTLMNNLPFESTALQHYENTFLQRVAVVFSYPELKKENVSDDFSVEFRKFLSVNFGLQIGDEQENAFWNDSIRLTRNDESMVWMLGSSQIMVMLGTKDYQTFVDSVLPAVYKMRKFVEKVLGQNAVTELRIRKINIWQFETDNNNKLTFDKIRSSVLSTDLLNLKTNTYLEESEKPLQNFKKILYKDGNDELYLRHFVNTINKATLLYLDTERVHIESVHLDKIEDALMEMNKELYDAYHWCVSPQIIEIMKGECK